MTTLGKRLRRLRRDLDLTQEDVALATGVQARSLRDWEAGKHMPSIASLNKLATLYGISMEDLVMLAVSSRPQDDQTREDAIAALREEAEQAAALLANAGDLGGAEV